MNNQSNSFLRGWLKLQNGQLKTVKDEIMKSLNITTPPGWYKRLNGNVCPTRAEIEAIERIFLKYGVSDIWGGRL